MFEVNRTFASGAIAIIRQRMKIAPPPPALIRVKELEDFEDKLANMIENLKERTHHNSFQTQLKKDAMVGH